MERTVELMMKHTRYAYPLVAAIVATATALAMAQTAPGAPAPSMVVTATSVNVNGAGETLEFFVNKWSTDAERDRLTAAWNLAPVGTGRGGAGRGGAGRGATPAGPEPANAAPAAPAAPAPAAAAAGRGGRGGRGGDAAAAPRTPEGALLGALRDLPAAGYFWTSEVGGYLIRYASLQPQPGGGNRIILLTDKRLGAARNNWQPTPPATPNSYEFTLIELRLPAKGEGEGKASLTGSLVVDPNTKSLMLDGYDAMPVTLKAVKARAES